MTTAESLCRELEMEGVSARKSLDRLPDSMFGWKPHEKSRTLGELGNHIANIPALFIAGIEGHELDRMAMTLPPAENAVGLVSVWDRSMDAAIRVLKNLPDSQLMEPWTYRYGNKVIFQMPKIAVLRSMGLNHLIHHRGQLAVYLRLLNVSVPAIYGPTADEN